MTLQKGQHFFENLNSEAAKKSEIRIYQKFLHIITGLKNRAFTEDEIQAIETAIDGLNLESNPGNRKRYYKKALNKFERFLKDAFSLTTKDYYTKLGIGLSLSFGILFGVVFLSDIERTLGISSGILIGMLIGLSIGRYSDSLFNQRS